MLAIPTCPALPVVHEAAMSDTSHVRNFNILPYELRAQVTKQYVWHELPVEEPKDSVPKLDQYARSLWTLVFLHNYDIVEHLTIATEERLELEKKRLARL